ncbi:hypothetical protein [Streptomyces antimycoticus]|uniref:hypothetical protein n=1 Tax=Streptomyces antimycoticus TaxID=68175 RepID=UPI0036B906FB
MTALGAIALLQRQSPVPPRYSVHRAGTAAPGRGARRGGRAGGRSAYAAPGGPGGPGGPLGPLGVETRVMTMI